MAQKLVESQHNEPDFTENVTEKKKKNEAFNIFRSNLKSATYEPVLFLYQLCYMITIATSQNVMLEKACRVDLDLGNNICTSLRLQNQSESLKHHEEILQKYVAPSVTLRTYTILTVPCILLLLTGFFSDNTGYRKVIPMIQIVAQMLICVNNLVQVYFMKETGLFFFVAAEALLEGLGGGYASVQMTAFSYMAKVTSVEERTFRIGLLYFSHSVSMPVGLAIVGPLLKHYGYYWCYSLSGCLNFINLMYNLYWIKEAKRSIEQKQHDRRGFVYFVRLYFTFSNVKETLRVVFKDGPNNRRVRIFIMLGIVSVLFGPMYGELSVIYMSTRYRFGWDELQFSIYQTYNFIIHTLGTVFSLVVFSKILKWHDSLLGIISTTSKIIGCFVYCFAATAMVFYMAPLVEILNGTSLLAMRSIMSKVVTPDELGKVNSIFGLTENLMPLIYVPLYTTVYTHTMEVLPGAVYLMGAGLSVPAVAVFVWLLCEHRREVRRLKKEERGVMEPLNRDAEISFNIDNKEAG
ncbi:solute carrier family 46 member 3-like isoform X1 [Leguminivora glycinivorella]|uniref:solute carrier family 46 member 3-like isoform X1 n=1 Tax=Leguminivora glycinivorella TaxID=1035111 RepID=UPI00200E897A|nr:solute carrier family 46 member 3-like isoform X1 [Leguminivora glycinivorella]